MNKTLVTICIATCKRVDYLKILLDKIQLQSIPENYLLEIAIADNDPMKSAEQFVHNYKIKFKYKIHYQHQEKRGIPFTRNLAVKLADTKSKFLIFIDDDEYPADNWLLSLLKTQELTNADLVQGVVKPDFKESPPKWLVKGRFMEYFQDNLKNGDQYPYNCVTTNNLLVRKSKLDSLDGPFNEKLGLIGCDDTELGFNLNEIGCKMVYASESVVFEFVPKERMKLNWFFQRSYRTANTHWLICKNKNFLNFLKFFTGGFARIFIGFLLVIPTLLISIFKGWQYFLKSIRLIIRGFAVLNGLFGNYYAEYDKAYTHTQNVVKQNV